jgi:hypothetical protein
LAPKQCFDGEGRRLQQTLTPPDDALPAKVGRHLFPLEDKDPKGFAAGSNAIAQEADALQVRKAPKTSPSTMICLPRNLRSHRESIT